MTYGQEYAAATQAFLDAVAALDPADLDRRDPAGWSPRQIVHHVADSEAQSYARLRRLLAEQPDPVIQGYDEGAWASAPKLGYETLPIDASLAVYVAVRASSQLLVDGLTEDDLDLSGTHTESGPYSVRTWLQTYLDHPRDHAAQLERAARGEA